MEKRLLIGIVKIMEKCPLFGIFCSFVLCSFCFTLTLASPVQSNDSLEEILDSLNNQVRSATENRKNIIADAICEDWRILGWCEEEVSEDLLQHFLNLNEDVLFFEPVKKEEAEDVENTTNLPNSENVNDGSSNQLQSDSKSDEENPQIDSKAPLRRFVTSLCPLTCGNLYRKVPEQASASAVNSEKDDDDNDDEHDDENDDENDDDFNYDFLDDLDENGRAKRTRRTERVRRTDKRSKRVRRDDFDWAKISSQQFKSSLYCVQDKCWRYYPSGDYKTIDFWYRMSTGGCDLAKLNYYLFKVVDWKTLQSIG